MTDELDALVKPLAWTEESPNFWIGRGSFGYQRDFRVFDKAAKVRIGTIGARVTPDHARGFYDREYVAFVLEAIDRTALDAVRRAAKVEAWKEVADFIEAAPIGTRQQDRDAILAPIEREGV